MPIIDHPTKQKLHNSIHQPPLTIIVKNKIIYVFWVLEKKNPVNITRRVGYQKGKMMTNLTSILWEEKLLLKRPLTYSCNDVYLYESTL